MRLLLPRIAACLATLLILSGCNPLAPDSEPFADPRYYTHELFGSAEECEAARQQGGWMNCSQVAVFCPNGRAEFMVTDIVHHASYGIRGSRLTLRTRENPEISDRIVFRVSADRESLTDVESGTVWERRPEQEAAATEHACG